MCYSAETIDHNYLSIAIHRSSDDAERDALLRKLEGLAPFHTRYYFADGFAHPQFLVFTNEDPGQPRLFHWGLIPSWIKSPDEAEAIARQTLNARGETICEKPAFRSSAMNKRCIVYVGSFYEHHHFANGVYPFRIRYRDGSPMFLAGLWDEWVHPGTAELIQTFSIVTTSANALMRRIHNNPKAESARMPVILSKPGQDEWLNTRNRESLAFRALIAPCDDALLEAYPVPRLKGRNAAGNTPAAIKPAEYPELQFSLP